MSRVVWVLEHDGDVQHVLDEGGYEEFREHLREQLKHEVPVIVVPAGHSLSLCETRTPLRRG